MNRALAGAYPPGSTFKPFVALAALETGLLRQDEVIQCTGEEVIDGQTFSNWDPYKNEPMTVSTALANSCDTFFYNLALRFYERKDSPLQRWSRSMGFGSGTGVDLGPKPTASCPRLPGGGERSRRRSTSSGRVATPCSWRSAREISWSARCR